MIRTIDTVIIGGGQAGLSTSYCLKQHNREHVVLEQAAQAGHAWRNDRWDSFTLVTPNWSFRLPGAAYSGPDPDGFMPRDAIVKTFETYAAQFALPVEYNTRALTVDAGERGGFCVSTRDGDWQANNVVVAAGLYQQPKIPGFADQISAGITQVHSGQYRSEKLLPPGAVLVVGSAQSGCQITEELYQRGRKVFQCVGGTGRVPRRYRGRDIFYWLIQVGYLDRTPAQLPHPGARFQGNPQVSGTRGGHNLNLHQFAHDGVTLLGRIRAASGDVIELAPDLKESLAKSDSVEGQIIKLIDGYIARNHLDLPEETLPVLKDGYASQEITHLNLREAGISTILWSMGYSFDFRYVKLPVFDDYGFPITQNGVTAVPGLYFSGLPWLPYQKTGILVGVGENASLVADHIAIS